MLKKFAVILPAAGSGTRFGGDKLLVDIGGRSVLQRSVRLFTQRADVALVVVVTGAERIAAYREHLGEDGGKVAFVVGGAQRWQSVMNGLKYVAGLADAPAFVGVHDAARPLCPQEVIDEAFASTVKHGAGLPCVAEAATLKRRGSDGCVAETVDRANLYQAQTPQCFGLRELLAGYEELVRQGRADDLTDDAQVFERIGGGGRKVPITAGAAVNMKITTLGDLSVARGLVGRNRE
jgi:2-C-methyl-D-erythritol 4-phosphate cytidylyltransferase